MSLRPDDRNPKSSRRERSRSRSRYDDDNDDSPRSSRIKPSRSSRAEDDQDDRSSKPKSRSRRDEDDEPLKPSKSRSRYDDEGDDMYQSKPKSRRDRNDDEHEDDVAEKTSSRSKRKSLRFDAEDDQSANAKSSAAMPTMPGAFDDDDHLSYDTRQTSRRTPGLSSMLGAVMPGGGRGDDEDEEPSDRRRDRDRRSKTEARSSRGAPYGSDDRVEELRRPSRKSASFHGREEAASAIPYPDTDHAFMPSLPAHMADDENYGMMLPYGAERPYDYDEDDEHLAYSSKPLSRSRTDDHEERPLRRPKSPPRSISFPQPLADSRDTASRRESQLESPMLSVRRPKDNGLSPGGRSGSSRLSVSTDVHGMSSGGKPPASPLLEPYHGTYQSVSPMPSPLAVPETGGEIDDELESFTLEERKPSVGAALSRKKSIDPKTGKKRVMLYDSEGDADKLAKALNHHEARPEPLIEVLPELTHDQLLALREQYKKRVKVSGRGVNLSKQIKATTTGNFGKVAYATSLGRWEAEAYWANFWYQAHSSNRELLIEALMGKTNAEMREINDSFKDKRYQDSLTLCMEKELKPDKFRAAVLTALEARRQEETDVWPQEYRNRDVEVLRRALQSREGGESAILDIVVRRSENHLREILKIYDRMYGENFAKAALDKSNNLVVSDSKRETRRRRELG